MSDFDEWWERVFGGENRIGWWTVPVFLAVGLFGAVVAGTLTVVYYSQQVSAIEDQTRAVREDLSDAVQRVQNAANEARENIESEVAAVREEIRQEVPSLDPEAAGVVLVEASIPPPAPPRPAPEPGASPGTERRQPPPPPPRSPSQRTGVAVAVAREGATTFFITSLEVVGADHLRGGTVEEVTVRLPGRSITGRVHDWDENHDAAVIRANVGTVRLAEWRPPDEPVRVGDQVFAVGYTPSFATIQLPTWVGTFEATSVLITSISPRDLPPGAALLDREGRLVGLVTPGYRPFGASGGSASVPIRALCGPLLQRCGPREE